MQRTAANKVRVLRTPFVLALFATLNRTLFFLSSKLLFSLSLIIFKKEVQYDHG